jgi:hypothetical protein
MDEVIPLEEERLSRRNRERIREAVAVVQVCAVPSLSEAAERAARHLAMFRIDWNEIDAGPADEVIQVTQSFGAVSRLDDDRDLDERGDGHQPSISGLDGFDKARRSGSRRRMATRADVSMTIY